VSDRGYSLVEMLISMAIMLTVFGGVCQLASPAHATALIQAELQDMEQRARIVADRLTRDLWLAGAGPIGVPRGGPLGARFTPILPIICCGAGADAPGSAFTDRVTIMYAPADAIQAVTATDISPGALLLSLAPGPSCLSPPLCGFADGDLLLVFDDSGSFDTFRIDLSSGLPMLLPRSSPYSATYTAGATAVRVISRTYFHDAISDRLFVSENEAAPQPIVDGVTAFRLQYRDSSGASLDVQLGDGPWRGGGGTVYDADLLRVRSVRVSFTIRSGLSGTGALSIPDLTSAIDVTLRNGGSG
jgi:prepilin-type N-terminal cleavage/methylation domain-containing protein